MNKTLKRTLILGCTIGLPLSAVAFASMSCSRLSNEDMHYKYIWNRSFSLTAIWQGAYVTTPTVTTQKMNSGTVWVLDHVPNGSKYEYYVGTNFHVANLFFQDGNGEIIGNDSRGDFITNGSSTAVCWTAPNFHDTTATFNRLDNSLYNSNLAKIVNVKQIKSSDNFWTADFEHYNPDWNQTNTNNLTDFSVLDIDFGNDVKGTIKNKLDSLNMHNTLQFKTNRYTNTGTSFYTLGYPGTLTGGNIQMDYSKGKVRNYTHGHIYNEYWDEADVNDMAGSYYIMGRDFYSWHGQSGSLVIDENYNVVALIDLSVGYDVRHEDFSGLILLSVGNKQPDDLNADIYGWNGIPNAIGNCQYNYIDDFCNYANLNASKYLVD